MVAIEGLLGGTTLYPLPKLQTNGEESAEIDESPISVRLPLSERITIYYMSQV